MKFTAILWFVALGFVISDVGASPSYNFYQKTCPNAEAIIAKLMKDHVIQNPAVAPEVLRLHFHDCFVRGCDASVLLNSTSAQKAEKDAMPNGSLGSFLVIDTIKQALENQCPQVVSCSDILAYAARESIYLTGKFQHYSVRGGRRDGRISRDFEAVKHLPPSTGDVHTLVKIFASKGLSLEDLVTLSGAHSIGGSFCSSLAGRYINFKNTGKPDLTLNNNLAASLRKICGNVTLDNPVVMDTITPTVLNNKYYTGLLQKKGLFTSDATLLSDKRTLREVQDNANRPSTWQKKFVLSMLKMGEIDVLTHTHGEIRRKCAFVN